MDFPVDYASLADRLERQELSSSTGRASPQVYGQLLAIYLLFNDTSSAKYLWKRIPEDIKKDNSELEAVWKVGKHLINRDYPALYSTINNYGEWPKHLGNIMHLIHDSAKNKAKSLISRAYSVLTLEKCTQMLGMSNAATIETIDSSGWSYDKDTGFVTIEQPSSSSKNGNNDLIGLDNGIELLDRLTEYILFLEQSSSAVGLFADS